MYFDSRHKVFTSFYHKDDQSYKDYIDRYFSRIIINKSVASGEYDPDDKDEYIKRLIRENKISDSSVVVVLIGPNTKKRKHVDWEIYAGLRASIHGNAGLVGIALPELPIDYYGQYYLDDLPARFADNLRSGYAELCKWDYAINNFGTIVQRAFDNRIAKRHLIDNSRLQMKRNL